MWNERYGEGLTLRLTGGLKRSTELNRTLGTGAKGAVVLGAAALLEIMAEAL